MIRNLKVLLLAGMAVAAFGAISASGAQAVEFHCASAPCRATLKVDGTGTTAHHVFVVKNSAGESVSFTCKVLDGEATSSTTTSPTLTFTFQYTECNAAGEPVEVRSNGCKYKFNASGTVTVECPEGKTIEVEITTTKCIARVGSQGPLTGIGYANINSKTEVTATAKVPNITTTFPAGETKAKCLLDPTKTPITSEYTTGNTIVTAETDPASGTPTMIAGWWE